MVRYALEGERRLVIDGAAGTGRPASGRAFSGVAYVGVLRLCFALRLGWLSSEMCQLGFLFSPSLEYLGMVETWHKKGVSRLPSGSRVPLAFLCVPTLFMLFLHLALSRTG